MPREDVDVRTAADEDVGVRVARDDRERVASGLVPLEVVVGRALARGQERPVAVAGQEDEARLRRRGLAAPSAGKIGVRADAHVLPRPVAHRHLRVPAERDLSQLAAAAIGAWRRRGSRAARARDARHRGRSSPCCSWDCCTPHAPGARRCARARDAPLRAVAPRDIDIRLTACPAAGAAGAA